MSAFIDSKDSGNVHTVGIALAICNAAHENLYRSDVFFQLYLPLSRCVVDSQWVHQLRIWYRTPEVYFVPQHYEGHLCELVEFQEILS